MFKETDDIVLKELEQAHGTIILNNPSKALIAVGKENTELHEEMDRCHRLPVAADGRWGGGRRARQVPISGEGGAVADHDGFRRPDAAQAGYPEEDRCRELAPPPSRRQTI